MTACLSQDELAELLSDHLDGGVREPRESHLGECARCQHAFLRLTTDLSLEACWLAQERAPAAPAGNWQPRAEFVRRLKELLGCLPIPADPSLPRPIIPGFEILEEVGRGGMGVVYKARQAGLNRIVALKVLHRRGREPSPELRRGLRGSQAIARLEHPNIVRIFEVGEHDGWLYGALEYLEGGSLGAQIQGIPWPPERAARMVRTLAVAVAAIHRQGLLHRDLKPSNVLLAGDGTPRIADFGLVQDLGEADAEPGLLMGTPSYMAPEQARAGTGEVGPAADIHALGAIFYELLTGRPPYRGATRLHTLQMVVHAQPLPPSRFQFQVPRDLEAICLRCLDKEPRRRYPSAEALARDLDSFLAGEPLAPGPAPIARRYWSWLRQRPAAAALGIACLACLAVAAWSLLEWRSAHRAYLDEFQRRQAIEQTLADMEATLYRTRLTSARQAVEADQPERARELLRLCIPQPGRPDLRDAEWHHLRQRCQAP